MGDKRKIWFIRKRYGWGWMPSPKTWQGWIIIIAFALLTGAMSQYILGPFETGIISNSEAITRIVIFSVGLAIEIYLLFKISYKYGEESRWQWGDKKDGQEK